MSFQDFLPPRTSSESKSIIIKIMLFNGVLRSGNGGVAAKLCLGRNVSGLCLRGDPVVGTIQINSNY